MTKEKDWLKFRSNYLQGKQNHQGYYVCQECMLWIKTPHVHHIELRGSHPDKVLDASNLKVLCAQCHRKKHNQETEWNI